MTETRTQGHETRKERVDRELLELLNELRVVLPGVQVLFAFLLTVPFTPRFVALSGEQRQVYFLAVVAVFVSTTLLMAPAAHHRLLFRQGSKERLLRVASILVLSGTAALAIGMSLVMYLIADLLYDTTAARVAAALAGLSAVLCWYGLPHVLRAPDGGEEPGAPEVPGRPPGPLLR